MRKQSTSLRSSVQNNYLVASESEGGAKRMLQRHRTFADAELKERIRRMSIIETIG